MGLRPILFAVAVFVLVSVCMAVAGGMGAWEVALAVGLSFVAGGWRWRREEKIADPSTAQ